MRREGVGTVLALALAVAGVVDVTAATAATAAAAERSSSKRPTGVLRFVLDSHYVAVVQSRLGELNSAQQHGLVDVGRLGDLVVDPVCIGN